MGFDPVSWAATAFALSDAAAAGTAATATAATTTAATAGAATAGLAGNAAFGLATLEGATIASSTPAWLSYAGLGTSLLGGGLSAYGAMEAGEARARAGRFNREVALINSQAAEHNAELAAGAAEAQAGIQSQKNRAQIGAIIANQGASGVDIDSGSSLDVRSSAAELGELNALTVRSNAIKEAYGYQAQSKNYEAEASLPGGGGSSEIEAASTFLGATSNAASNFARYQLESGGFTG